MYKKQGFQVFEQRHDKPQKFKLKGNSNVFFIGLLIRTFKVTVTSVVNFLITCLVSEILKGKEGQSHQPLAILHIQNVHDVTTRVIVFLFKNN